MTEIGYPRVPNVNLFSSSFCAVKTFLFKLYLTYFLGSSVFQARKLFALKRMQIGGTILLCQPVTFHSVLGRD